MNRNVTNSTNKVLDDWLQISYKREPQGRLTAVTFDHTANIGRTKR